MPTAGSYGVGSRGGSGSGYVSSYLLPHEDYTTISTDPIPIGSHPVTAARSASYASNLLRTVSDCASAFENFPLVNFTSTLSLEKFLYVINFPEIFYNCLRIIVPKIWHKKLVEPLQLVCCFYQDHFGFLWSSGNIIRSATGWIFGCKLYFQEKSFGKFYGCNIYNAVKSKPLTCTHSFFSQFSLQIHIVHCNFQHSETYRLWVNFVIVMNQRTVVVVLVMFWGVQIHSVVDRSYQPRFPIGLLGDNISPTGELFGWIMAAIYMGGRLPQIWLNVCLPAHPLFKIILASLLSTY